MTIWSPELARLEVLPGQVLDASSAVPVARVTHSLTVTACTKVLHALLATGVCFITSGLLTLAWL
jgi:hypothetical protein